MDNWQFWLAAAAMVLAVAATIYRALLRAGPAIAPAASYDLQVYRDQLAEVDRDLARGTLPAEEAARLRTEISRRLLDADRKASAEAAPPSRSATRLALLLALPVLGASALVYDRLGAPGYPDLPLAERLAMSDEMRAKRPSQAQMEADAPKPEAPPVDPAFAKLMDELRAAMKTRPDDQRGLELLAANEARLGNLAASRAAMEKLIALKGKSATAEDHAALAEVMVMATGGLVSPEAEAELTAALTLDASNPTARYYYGVMAAQVGRFDRTFELWQPLLDGPADAPWMEPVRAQIEDVAFRAGINFTLPDAKGPDAGAVAAAQDMSAGDRQAMIEGMVAQLGDSLATEGGPVEDWAKLITSLGVLDRKDEAQKIYTEALAKFEGRPSEQGFLKEAALNAGLTP
ncbi:c-type cytochrome biogenesis protein CcmI [Paragemmobacter straminiformis]|uniref:C-type cytochrome biogenesis protein CcmI n=1 Tax=Paragemmobacter straminiformis TaxID=2045119 RepID=A0A842I8L1_9RHOB|nr:c-type cytochrome biogenesis protein CcmI [Gemmobacter straminiformis]MBC2835911.1 c-type cytochrome biogenesis protein CcmI [Gemmobacter straminiformis]